MKRALVIGTAVTALLLAGCSSGADKPTAAGTPVADSPTGSPADTTVSTGSGAVAIKDFAFSPSPVTVSKGTTITWTNMDSAVHSVAFKGGGMTNSKNLEQNDTFSFTADKSETIDYLCGIHNYMVGQIVVS